MENYLLSEIERRYSVVRCVRFVVGGAGWSACPAGGRKWKVNDAKTGNGILWIVGNRLPVPLLARARTSRARSTRSLKEKANKRPVAQPARPNKLIQIYLRSVQFFL